MPISIDPLTFIIYVPKSYLTLDSGTLYTMDTDQFRLDLKDLEDNEGGIIFQKTHNHNTEVSIAGTTFVRGIKILAPYSVEFEDGQYTVILEGSNNNIFDVASGILVQNQVQVIPTNSAGLVITSGTSGATAAEIADAVWDEPIANHSTLDTAGYEVLRASYTKGVHVHEGGGSGTAYPFGTEDTPVGSIADGITIANLYNIKLLHIEGSVNVLATDDVSGFTLIADRSLGNSVTVASGATTAGTYFENLTVSGVMGGSVRYTTSVLGAITNFDGGAKNSLITENIYITGSGANYFTDCDIYVTDHTAHKEIHVNSSTVNIIRSRGNFKIMNKTSTNTLAIDLVAGVVEVDSTCTAGFIGINGIAEVTDNSGAGCTVFVLSMSHTAISQNVWDEPLTAALHNEPTSAGKRLRGLTSSVIRNELAQGSGTGNNQIQLDVDASSVDGAYDPAAVSIIGGTGNGQTRMILEYVGATRTATVDRSWKVLPDATSEFAIITNVGREHVNEGLAQGGTSTTITLNSLASSTNNLYSGQIIFIRSGTGEDQACRIQSYDGTTKEATVCNPWNTIPDTTSAYVVLPTATITNDAIANSVWNADMVDYTTAGTFGLIMADIAKLTGNKVTKSGDVITIYEDDDTTVWRQYNLAGGGRLEV